MSAWNASYLAGLLSQLIGSIRESESRGTTCHGEWFAVQTHVT
ncbi:MAG: hypothetical protein WBM48_02950 [Polyangiales bacterium]